MRVASLWWGVTLGCLLAAPAFGAGQDSDLDLIPPAAQPAPSPLAAQAPSPNGAQRNYLEGLFSATPLRDSLAVAIPPPTPASWQGRMFLDMRDAWRVTDTLTLNYSGRFNLRAANDLPFPSHENVLNELRETYASWEPAPGTWIDLGRINVKSGVAVGYNPTDFFRSRAVVEPTTADPSVLREDRLGTLMLTGQHTWQGGSITVGFAPRVTLPTAIYKSNDLPSFDPMLDRTNAEFRYFIKGSFSLADDFAPEVLLYHAGNLTKVGTNLTMSMGRHVVGYLEWAGGVDTSLIDSALRYGRQTGTLPANAPSPIPVDTSGQFQNDLAIGASYASESNITVNLEYHFYQPGFSHQDWRNWFAAGAGKSGASGVASTLWYIRSYAIDQQVPTSRHSVFLRANWVDAFVPYLNLTAIANVSLIDGSGFVQGNADYYLSQHWTIGGLGSFTFGTRRSEFGSLPQVGTILLRIVRYM